MMVHKYIKRGLNHANYCEDFLLHEQLKDKFELFGVFDGCGSGIDSHFASAFIAKIVRKEFYELCHLKEGPEDEFIKELLFKSIVSLKELKKNLKLDRDELLSTVLLFLFNKTNNSGFIVTIGDGLVSINGINLLLDENNTPDYLAYHIDNINSEFEFEKWLTLHTKTFNIDEINDISISTDGAQSFIDLGKIERPETKLDVFEFLFQDQFLISNKAMLGRKCNILERKYGMVNADDLAIIRLFKA